MEEQIERWNPGMSERAWLLLILLSTVPAMVLGMRDVSGNRISLLVLAAYTVFPLVATRSLSAVGITRSRLLPSVLVGGLVGVAYGVVRGLILRFVAGSSIIFGADLALIAPRLRGSSSLSFFAIRIPLWAIPLLILLVTPFLNGIELYFRGFLFRQLKRFIPWPAAIAVASTVQAIARRTPHSLVMESIAGVLMQRYDNIFAPLVFHGFQFAVALVIFINL